MKKKEKMKESELMADFCQKCGSLKLKGNCSNHKCSEHSPTGFEPATYKQVEYITELVKKLGKDTTEYNFREMSKKDASRMIDILEEDLELN